MILEACISTKNGLIHAQEFNIPRIELCENISLDGLTPSLVFQKKAKTTLGWEPKTELKKGLLETIKYFEDYE